MDWLVHRRMVKIQAAFQNGTTVGGNPDIEIGAFADLF